VTGKIPSYAAGTLYRTGPAQYKIQTSKGDTFKVSHWFDGFTTVHRFQILPSEGNSDIRVMYNSRCTVDQLIRRVEKTGLLDNVTFAQKRDPCQSYFKKVMSVYWPAGKNDASDKNIGVTLSVNLPGPNNTSLSAKHASGIQHLTEKTDSSTFKDIDPETLEPIGIASQTSFHPDLKGQMSGAHAKSDPVTGDVYNFNLEISRKATYRVFRTSASTGETTILAKFSDTAAYLHSFFLTADHVVLCLWNSHLSKGGLSILLNFNILDSIVSMDPSLPARWYVIDRKHGKGVLATYESPAFFCFHTVNAWTEPSATDPSATDIVCTLSAFENTDVLKKFYYENLLSTASAGKGYVGEKGNSCRPELRQYRLHAVPSTETGSPAVGKLSIDFSAPKLISVELPTINPRFVTKPNRYTYGIVDRSKSTFVDGLGKFDAQMKTTLFWEQHGHSPGEAIFVPNPEGEAEDDGVLLSVVLDGIKGNSYLLCLNARDMTELGKAHIPGVVGFGFHGTFWNGKSLEL
jgi:torulene dioxygenase